MASNTARRPSVLFLNRVYPPSRGATGRMLRDLARSFAIEGWMVTVITTGQEAVRQKDGTIRILRVKANPASKSFLSYAWIWIRLLIEGLRMEKHDLVVTLTDPPMLVVAGRMIASVKKSRHINWCHDLYPDLLQVVGTPVPGFMTSWLRRMARRAM